MQAGACAVWLILPSKMENNHDFRSSIYIMYIICLILLRRWSIQIRNYNQMGSARSHPRAIDSTSLYTTELSCIYIFLHVKTWCQLFICSWHSSCLYGAMYRSDFCAVTAGVCAPILNFDFRLNSFILETFYGIHFLSYTVMLDRLFKFVFSFCW